MKEVAIIGVGLHPWGKYPGKTWEDLAYEAAQKALKDANLEWTDIPFVCGGSDPWSGHYGMLAGSTLAYRLGLTGIPVINCYNACATGSYALKTAQAYINSGAYDIVLCVAGSVSPSGFYGVTAVREFDPTDMDSQRFRILGETNPTMFAYWAARRMHLYGATQDDFAQVKVKNSKHASANPNARYKKVFTKEEVLNSPMVAYPLHLYDICATSDGGAALVLCSLEKAKQYTTKPVILAGVGCTNPKYPDPEVGMTFATDFNQGMLVRENHRDVRCAMVAYEEAGMGPEDLSLAEVYDLATSYELGWYENIGLCKEGEAEALLREGATAIGGRIPVNTSGGVGASGEAIPAQAMYQACELVWQMRGEAGGRQVEGAKAGLGINAGLQGNSSAVIMKR